MALSDASKTLISIKKLVGKAHTSNDKDVANESLPTGITVASNAVFGQAIPVHTGSSVKYEILSSSSGVGTVEFLRLSASFIAGTDTSSGRHGFSLQLPDDYESHSKNPKKGTYPFLNRQQVYITSGSLQLVPPSFDSDYEGTPYHTGSGETQIAVLDARDWSLDYFNGIFFQQDPPATGDSTSNPRYIDAYLYIGKMLDSIVTSGSVSGSDGSIQISKSGMFDTDSDLFFDVTNKRLGIRTSSPSLSLDVGGSAVISGSLTVLGDHSVIDSQHLQVEDGIIGLGTGSAGEGAAGDRGLIFLINGETNPSFYWDESENEFRIGRLTSVPGDSAFSSPTAAGQGGYQQLRVGNFISEGYSIFSSGSSSIMPGNDTVFFVSGSTNTQGTTTKGTALFGGDLVTSGNIHAAEYIYHENDSDTFVRFEDDTIYFDAGGRNFIKIIETGTDKLIINNGALDIDLQVKGNSSANLLRTDAANDSVYFGANNASGVDNSFWVSGSIGSKNTSDRGTAVFGGDIVSSGTIDSISGFSGSITNLIDGRSYIVAGENITITSASNGQVIITTSESSLSRVKIAYSVTGSHASGNRLAVPGINFSDVGYDPNKIDVFVNGQLMMTGSNKDYILQGSAGITFNIELFQGDTISAITIS